MNIFTQFEGKIEQCLSQLDLPKDIDLSRISVEPPRDPEHGDLSTNAAMVLAKPLSISPRDLASKIVEQLNQDPDIESLDIAGPGFINISLPNATWQKLIGSFLTNIESSTKSVVGRGKKINIEYVSANPTGPMHVGHCRGAIFGDALAKLLLSTGHDVTKEYYINDAGAQVDVLARSAYLRYLEALGEEIGDIPEGLYPGDYLKSVGEELAKTHGDKLKSTNEEEWLPIIRETAISKMMEMIRDDLALLNIEHDEFFSEKSLTSGTDKISDTISDLNQKGLIYEGRLPPPKGQLPDDWEDREQTLFKATQFGDDVDRALKKSDGSYTYFAADIAYHKDKVDRGFGTLINVWGADHGGYIKRMNAAISALSNDRTKLDVKICQLVRLFKNGEPYKMSKRAGEFITLRDVVEEVGPDVTRFMMLFRKNDAPLDFDFTKVMEQSRENPVFYVQYAYARINSVFKQAKQAMNQGRIENFELSRENFRTCQSELLNDRAEIDLMKHIATYPRLLEQAARAQEPHRIAFYLYELASAFHSLWNLGKEKPNLRFIIDNDVKLTHARLALLFLCQNIIAAGLEILGVIPAEEMT